MRLLWICFLALPLLAQQEKLVSLSGTVVNEATGEPVKRAQVQITHFSTARRLPGDDGPMRPLIRTAFTDARGSFRFDGLPEGQYGCMAQKPQFVAAPNSGACAAPSDSVRLTLSPLGVITGRIVDQDGLPLRLVNVYALSSRIQEGLRQIQTDRTVTTDDRGMYRLWNLRPGKYFIKASGFAAGTVTYIGDTSPSTPGESFPVTYFSGANTRDSATPIDVKPGTDAIADLTLNVDRAYSIRGTLSGIVPRVPVKFELVTGNDASPVRVTLNNEIGKFEVGAVSPGSYTLRAIQDKAIAEMPLTMPASDIAGVAMTLEPPVDIPVTLRFTNESRALETIEGPQMNAFCTPLLYAAEGTVTLTEHSQAAKAINGVSPGRYRVTLQCFSAYIRSAVYGSQDVVTNPIITVASGSATSLDVVATNGGGMVTGKIETVPDKPVSVIFVPQFGGDPIPVRAQSGEFEWRGFAPGRYLAYAFSNIDEVEFRDPDLIRTLTGGVSVDVEEGKEQKITIPGVVR